MEAKDFAKGAIVGAIAGVLGGVLLAPKSGEETRDDITSKFNEIKDIVIEKMEDVSDFSKDVYDRIVGETLASFEAAKKIAPEDAKKISEIFEKSFADIEKILEKDAKKVAEPLKKK